MDINKINRWNVNYRQAVEIQKKLRKKLRLASLRKKLRAVAGADISYDKKSDRLYAAVVVLNAKDFSLIEKRFTVEKAAFPYIPGLLSFREIPPLIKVFRMLKTEPDVIICDGQGIAHPRGFGLASHLGVLLGIPTVGCAKSRLVGEYKDPPERAGGWSKLLLEKKVIGSVLRTRKGVKPLFVSPGHLTDFASARKIVLKTCTKYRISEPVRQAHIFVNLLRKKQV